MLLDSHVVLWLVGSPDRLGLTTLSRLESGDAVHVSAASIWELTIKSMLGKLSIPDDFEQRLWTFGFEPLAVDTRHADGLRSLPEFARHDPFDRLLLSQAKVEELELLTVDRVLLDLDLPFVVDARR